MTRKTHARKLAILGLGAFAVLAFSAAMRDEWGRIPGALAFLYAGCLLAYVALSTR